MTTLESLYEEALADGIAVTNFPMPQTVAAAVEIDGKYYVAIDKTRLESSIEEAECLAHELGHCHTMGFYRPGERNRTRLEKRAEEWAILRLIPPKRFYHALKKGCREVWELAEELGTSYRFAEKVARYYQRKLYPNAIT